jgi:hypothetical protein
VIFVLDKKYAVVGIISEKLKKNDQNTIIKYKIKDQHEQLSWTKIKASLNDKCKTQRNSN